MLSSVEPPILPVQPRFTRSRALTTSTRRTTGIRHSCLSAAVELLERSTVARAPGLILFLRLSLGAWGFERCPMRVAGAPDKDV